MKGKKRNNTFNLKQGSGRRTYGFSFGKSFYEPEQEDEFLTDLTSRRRGWRRDLRNQLRDMGADPMQ
jgi:hypothetical protein